MCQLNSEEAFVSSADDDIKLLLTSTVSSHCALTKRFRQSAGLLVKSNYISAAYVIHVVTYQCVISHSKFFISSIICNSVRMSCTCMNRKSQKGRAVFKGGGGFTGSNPPPRNVGKNFFASLKLQRLNCNFASMAPCSACLLGLHFYNYHHSLMCNTIILTF